MKKRLLLLIFVIFFLLFQTSRSDWGLGKLSEAGFRSLFRHQWARQVFDLEEEEAVAVFGEEGEAYFL